MAAAQVGKSVTPVPDPTTLTTQSLLREIAGLRELLEARLSTVSLAVNQLEELHQEKFNSIAIQFRERDTRAEQSAKDSKIAVDAALQAAKEAVGEQNKSSALAIAKSESATMKQIDQIASLITTLNKSLDDKVVDIKDRMTLIEGHSKGSSDLWGYVAGAVGLLIGFAGIVITALRSIGSR